MKGVARHLFLTSLLLALGAAAAGYAQATYPKSIVTLATHSSPGGGSDVFLREMVPHLSRIMKVTFVVDNLQGGSGARAMATLARAKPDGGMFYATTPTYVYTSLLSTPAATYRDLEPLVNIFYDPEVLYTAADSQFKTLQDVLDRARQGRRQMGRGEPCIARASGDGAAEAESRRHAGCRDVRRRRRFADQRPEPHARHGDRRIAGAARRSSMRARFDCWLWSEMIICPGFLK